MNAPGRLLGSIYIVSCARESSSIPEVYDSATVNENVFVSTAGYKSLDE